MSRGMVRTARPYAVWLAVTAVAVATALAAPGAWRDAAGAGPSDRVVGVLVAGCATALALASGWLWALTSVTVWEVVSGSAPRGGGTTRRLVLLACGAAVTAGAALPAHAAEGDGAEVLVGLALPERAVAPAVARPAGAVPASRSTTGATYVVRTGDSLWSIARAHPAPGVGVEARWRAIWHHNRGLVGDDPDLIHPGQALRLPDTDSTTDTDEDGERR